MFSVTPVLGVPIFLAIIERIGHLSRGVTYKRYVYVSWWCGAIELEINEFWDSYFFQTVPAF